VDGLRHHPGCGQHALGAVSQHPHADEVGGLVPDPPAQPRGHATLAPKLSATPHSPLRHHRRQVGGHRRQVGGDVKQPHVVGILVLDHPLEHRAMHELPRVRREADRDRSIGRPHPRQHGLRSLARLHQWVPPPGAGPTWGT
jgi:hypothetical protein